MDEAIHDIGRPRLRSSRPTPPSDAQREWAESMAREDVAERSEAGPETGREEKVSSH